MISNGKFIVENKQLVSANQDDILSFAKEQGERLWQML